MLRTWILCALAAAVTAPVQAQNAADTPAETLIKFDVAPAAVPKPALRYRLLPELNELNPGNPIQGYLKCFMEQQNFFFNKEMVEQREKWQTCPLDELPDLKDYGGSALSQADYAARLESPDWQILQKLKAEGISVLLPEIQQLRMLAGALKVRFRGAVKDRRFDDAARSAATMFALARHLGEHPTLIGELVGVAIAMIAMGPLEEMLQQPGCPNLYWSLTALPSPFIDLRKALQGEKVFLPAEFPMLVSTDPLSEAQLEKCLQKIGALANIRKGLVPVGATEKEREGKEMDAVTRLRARAKDDKELVAARKALIDVGFTDEQLSKMPPVQVILLFEVHLFEVERDEATKWGLLPYWQAEAAYTRVLAVRAQGSNPVGRGGQSVFGELVPVCVKVHMAQARIDQRLALLRHVEAVRLYASEHGGKVPPTLADASVPLPVDPFTGKAFRYEVKGNTAIIRGSPPMGMEQQPLYNIRYEVTIKQ